MPLQYPNSSPYNPYTEPKAPKNWPKIIQEILKNLEDFEKL